MPLNAASIVFVCLAASCGLISSFLLWQEIGEVNRKLPDDQQISYFWGYPEKIRRIKKEYKRLYPNGKIERFSAAFQIAAIVFMILAAVAWFVK